MKLGVQARATAEGVDLIWIAQELERRGFESIFLPEHSHVPVGGTSLHPGGVDIVDAAKSGFDPFIGLALVAATTRHLRVGTRVCMLPQHEPIVPAKEIAMLDVLSGDRVILGVAAGWACEAMTNHGLDPARRLTIAREKALAMKAIWTKDKASFHGEYVDFDPLWEWPKPIQRSHPPILLGGEDKKAPARVIGFGGGWFPNWEPDTADRVALLQNLASQAVRPSIPVTTYWTPRDPAFVGSCIQAGVDRIASNLSSAEITETTQVLNELSSLIDGFSASAL